MPVHITKVRKILSTALLLLVILPGITVSGFNSAPVMADGMADLIVQNIILSPPEPTIDDSVTIIVTVKNQGTAGAGLSYVVCYADSAILATVPINQLDAGTMATVTFNWKAEQGAHIIKAIADSSNTIIETNEANNTKTYAITTLAVDLIIQSITWLPAVPSRGDIVTISVVVKNQGSAPSRNTILNLYIDGSTRGAQDVTAINPGGTATRTYTWTALAGQHPVKAAVDEPNTIRESVDTNNDKTVTFSTAAPDLLIEKIIWAPVNPSKNDTVSINATVKNQGTGRADTSHVAFYMDGELKSTIPVSALEAGTSVNITFSWKVIAEKHEIKTIIDPYQNVVESDETNNEKKASFQTLAPDLAVTKIDWLPADAAVGDGVTFSITIKNLGAGRSEKSRGGFYIDGALVTTPDIPEINGYSEKIMNLPWVATGGPHPVSFHADYDLALVEITHDNNKFSTNIDIVPPDIVIPSIAWSPENFAIDDIVTFTVMMRNQGGGRADSFDIVYYMDDVPLTPDLVVEVASGASTNRTCTWKAINGRHVFKAIADFNHRIAELDENNNTATVTVAPNMPDLAVDTITWSPAEIKAGSDVTFDIVIKNLGTLGSGPTRLAYYVDGAVTGYTDIGQLDADATVIVPFVWSALAGVHNIDVVADSTNKIFEIDEVNNTKVISLPPPDMTIQGIAFSPAGAAIGDNVTFTATIKNQGIGRSKDSRVTCYVDGIAITTRDVPQIDPGRSVTSAFNWIATAGRHKIKVTTDADNRLTEIDETNNNLETDFITLTPDLIIKEISWLMENPLTDDKVAFTITVKNQGTGTAGASNMTYAVDKGTAFTVAFAPLPSGNALSTSFTSYLKAGPHLVEATMDPENKINEFSEANNSGNLTFSTIVPDLTVKTITLTPAAALPGDTLTINVKMENRGREKALNTKLSLLIDGAAADFADFKVIEVGALISQDFTWKAVAGNHEILAYADFGSLIPESNEANNSKSRTVTFEKPPSTAAAKPIMLSSTTPADKGFLASWWWLLLLIAGVLGGAAFYSMLRSFKKG